MIRGLKWESPCVSPRAPQGEVPRWDITLRLSREVPCMGNQSAELQELHEPKSAHPLDGKLACRPRALLED